MGECCFEGEREGEKSRHQNRVASNYSRRGEVIQQLPLGHSASTSIGHGVRRCADDSESHTGATRPATAKTKAGRDSNEIDDV